MMYSYAAMKATEDKAEEKTTTKDAKETKAKAAKAAKADKDTKLRGKKCTTSTESQAK